LRRYNIEIAPGIHVIHNAVGDFNSNRIALRPRPARELRHHGIRHIDYIYSILSTRQVCLIFVYINISYRRVFDEHSSLIWIERIGYIDNLQPRSAVSNIRASIRDCDIIRISERSHLSDDDRMLRCGHIDDLQARRTVRYINMAAYCNQLDCYSGCRRRTYHRHCPRISSIHDADVAATCNVHDTGCDRDSRRQAGEIDAAQYFRILIICHIDRMQFMISTRGIYHPLLHGHGGQFRRVEVADILRSESICHINAPDPMAQRHICR